MKAGSATIDIEGRDMDVPLSPLGEQQSAALGEWFYNQAQDERPEVILASPYERARKTAGRIARTLAVEAAAFEIDERLREKELGLLDRLTRAGIEARYPEQAQLRTLLGKFYYRPPGGESWCDVIFRLRAVLDSLCLLHAGRRVLIVSHQVVVLCFRYLLEHLDEGRILAIDSAGEVANCGVTEYAFDGGAPGGLKLVRYNFIAPLEESGTPVTAEPSKSAALP